MLGYVAFLQGQIVAHLGKLLWYQAECFQTLSFKNCSGNSALLSVANLPCLGDCPQFSRNRK